VILAAPSNYYEAQAVGVGGNEQVGAAMSEIEGQHAMLWFGSSDSVVDLHPTGFAGSIAYATDGTQQVGSGWILATGLNHAVLWYGTAASAIDLNPSGFVQSEALATNGVEQVGHGAIADGTFHALLWTGSADSAIDLNDLLPQTGTWLGSTATSIDPDGNVYGSADGTYDGIAGTFLVEWSPIPEPASISLLTSPCIAMIRRRHHRPR
jgi:hypothetical protein